jgi:hypothetical protein
MTDRAIPGWPRVLNEAWAAAYIGMSPSSFRRGPAADLTAINLTAQRKGWLRDDLDEWVDRQAGRSIKSAGDGWEDLGNTG